MDYCLTPYLPKINSKNYDTLTRIHKLRLFHNFYLPIGYKVITRKPYNLKNSSRTGKEAEHILNERLNKKINEFQQNGLEIIKNDVTIVKNGDKMEAKGKISVIEPIARLKKDRRKE
jgi:hypothetical protein